MTETVLVKQEIRPEKVQDLKDWMDEVRNRMDEIVETLQDEGVKTESVFLEDSAQGAFLVTYMEAEDVQKAQQTFAESTNEIDVQHKQTLEECLVDGEPVSDFELLYHATNPDR
jgi:L-rhamnose mutarotase